MPRETVAVGSASIEASTIPPEHQPEGTVNNRRAWSLAISWHRADDMTGWVQADMIPEAWQSTGDWKIVDLDRAQIDHLIRVLKRARRQAFPAREPRRPVKRDYAPIVLP